MADDCGAVQTETGLETEQVQTTDRKITTDMRYHYLHREERNKQRLERYHNDPNVIARRQERERKKAEREAILAAKRAEKERKIRELTIESEKTRRKMIAHSALFPSD